jgi:pyruvate dehydrogenase E2 component (dihydrolipoamide acetyltransferase)
MALHAEVSGDPAAATPLVLLHGFGGVASVWRDVIARLPVQLPIIAYDMPGHGLSLDVEAGGAGRMAKAVFADLDRRGISQVHLCGHSLGGATACLIALRAPERVVSLMLLAPGGFGPDINARALADWRDASSEADLRAALRPMCAEGFEPPQAMITALAEARRRPGAQDALEAIYASMFMPGKGQRQGTLPLADLAGLPCLVRVLWGMADEILPVAQSEGLPENVAVERLDGAGHMLIEERPEAVARALIGHLR